MNLEGSVYDKLTASAYENYPRKNREVVLSKKSRRPLGVLFQTDQDHIPALFTIHGFESKRSLLFSERILRT